ncbi:YciC family protein [Shigella boydii]
MPKLFILIFSDYPFSPDWHHAGGRSGNSKSAVPLALAPVMLVQDGWAFLPRCVAVSAADLGEYAYSVAPAVLGLVGKTLLLLFASSFAALTPEIKVRTGKHLSNLISAILLIYLFRLYMLISRITLSIWLQES